jgi:hypothetical protein
MTADEFRELYSRGELEGMGSLDLLALQVEES